MKFKVAKWRQDCQVFGQHCQVLFLAKTPLISAYFVNIAKIAKSLRAGSLRFTTVDTEYRRGTRRFFNHDGTTFFATAKTRRKRRKRVEGTENFCFMNFKMSKRRKWFKLGEQGAQVSAFFISHGIS